MEAKTMHIQNRLGLEQKLKKALIKCTFLKNEDFYEQRKKFNPKHAS